MLYPERVYSAKYNREPIIKPLLANQQPARPQRMVYCKFG